MKKDTQATTPATPSTSKEWQQVHSDTNGKVEMRLQDNGLREWKMGERTFQQTEAHPVFFIRRGDTFNLNKLDGFRLNKLAVDKKYATVVETTKKEQA